MSILIRNNRVVFFMMKIKANLNNKALESNYIIFNESTHRQAVDIISRSGEKRCL